MDTIRTSYSLFIHRLAGRSARDVPAAQCRQFRHGGEYGNDFRAGIADVLDTSINMAMQPFKMMVGDMVNEKQKGLAYSIQSFLCNAGSLVGYLFPFIFAWVGISNTAPQGVIPDSVIYSFYIGAAILIFCVIYTTVKVKEMPPAEYAEYHGITEEQEHEKVSMLKLLIKAPKAFWTVGLVQFSVGLPLCLCGHIPTAA